MAFEKQNKKKKERSEENERERERIIIKKKLFTELGLGF
jgi:hypothetical protein